MTPLATTAVVMARGLGTRMQHDAAGAQLNQAQRTAASLGLKTMMPDSHGRPFLAHILSRLADAGVTDVILVVAPQHDAIRSYFTAAPPQRVTLHYAVQPEPTGTADAVLAASPAVGNAPFLVCNADNLYPLAALTSLVELDGPGVVAFDRDALVRESNIGAERIAAFATLTVTHENLLQAVMEKPGPVALTQDPGQWIGMNLWRFDTRIFTACREVPLSVRGEKELPEAVALAIAHGMKIQVVPLFAGVLDLSNRHDVTAVIAQLDQREIAP